MDRSTKVDHTPQSLAYPSGDTLISRRMWVSARGEPPARAVITWPETDGEPVTIELVGVLCTLTVQRVGGLIDDVGRSAAEMVDLDLNGVTFIDGRGVSMIVALQQSLGERGVACRITRCSNVVRRLFHIVRLGEHLPH